jgi:predicted  nucleic acid-binding Zn-ribbon protein
MDRTVRTLIALALEGRRSGLRKSVSNVFLAVYDASGCAKRRPAVVEVRRGHCGGCHLRLPAQLDSTIRQRRSLYSCPHCGRILYASASRDPR